MTSKYTIFFFFLLSFTAAILARNTARAGDQDGTPPNIVLIVADDLGYGVLGNAAGQVVPTRSPLG